MNLQITDAILYDVEPAIEDAIGRATGSTDPTDPTYLKIHNGKKNSRGCVIDANEADLKELISRGKYKIEVAIENIQNNDDAPHWRGQLRAWRSLIEKAKLIQTELQNATIAGGQ